MLSLRPALARARATRQSVLLIASIALLGATYFWHLASLTAGKSVAESQTYSFSHSLRGFSGHALNLPHNFFLYLEIHFKHASLFNERAVSALFALIIIGCFYYLMRVWFGRFVGYIAALMFAFTPLVILTGRSATADIMLLLPICIAACYFWLIRSKPSGLKAALLGALAALCLYAPGGLWLVIGGAIYSHVVLAGLYKKLGVRARFLVGLTMAALVAPLVYAVTKHPAQAHGLLLIPTAWDGTITTLKNIAWMASGLVWHTNTSSDYQIGQLGLLTIPQIVLAAFGIYAMWGRARAKAYAFIAMIGFGVLLAGLNSNYALLLIPLVAVSVFVAAGLRFLLLEWQTVFPRNPLPRGLASVLFCALLAMQVVYGLRYGLVAWPHTDQVRQTYVLK